jgi:GNAT superfamily N-acetyltransferase
MTSARVREIDTAQVTEVLDLVLGVFREHIAPLYPPAGAAEFERYASTDAQARRLASGHLLFVAETDQEGILGVAELREFRHLSMFFVKTAYQRRGVGRKLLAAIVARCKRASPASSQLTVHASPNSVSAYRRLGFASQGPEQEKNGIRFVPMALSIGATGGA